MLADDRTSSATLLAQRAESLLREARAHGPAAVRITARQVCVAQPSMSSLWNLAAASLDPDPDVFERLVARAGRAPSSVARYALALLKDDTRRVLTCSRSAVVEACVRALALPVVCAESRPRLEGRGLAADLAADGLAVTVVSDAAIGSQFRPGDVVLVGADAIASEWFINKTGTSQLCAAAELAGIPAYVVAGRDKCVADDLAGLLTLRDDEPSSLWDNPPAGIDVSNPLFEKVPLERVVGVITDSGLLAGAMVRAACAAVLPFTAVRALVDLLAQD
jgi:translation initiation factor 2B subunit (eIF-2B alpha/beta/delta family)